MFCGENLDNEQLDNEKLDNDQKLDDDQKLDNEGQTRSLEHHALHPLVVVVLPPLLLWQARRGRMRRAPSTWQ